MTTRWKVMAGVLTLSVGGLAAVAGPCPTPRDEKSRRADDAPLPLLPVDPPKADAGKPTPPPVEVPPPAAGGLPPLPQLPPPQPSAEPSKLPPVPPPVAKKPEPIPPAPVAVPPLVIPAGGVMPPAPAPALPAAPPLPAVAPPTFPDAVKPMAPPAGLPVAAPTAAAPDLPPAPVGLPSSPTPPPGFDLPPTAPALPTTNRDLFAPPAPAGPPKPAPSKAGGLVPDMPAVGATVGLTPAAQPLAPSPDLDVPSAALRPAVVPVSGTAPAVAAKYRIVLRVGEGDPVFEVRHGDDLVMKVTSERVDVKSADKAAGQSAVTAAGKVRFVGFGSEGTCDTLSFLAGSGEVAMTGSVKVQVRDKIGRVESELSAESMKYKIDTTALPGSIKP